MLPTVAPPSTRRRTDRWVIALALLVLAVGAAAGLLLRSGPTETRRAAHPRPAASSFVSVPGAGPVPVPAVGAYLGVYTRGNDSGTASFEEFEHLIGRPVAIDHSYYRWDQPFPTLADKQIAAQGHIPFWNWQTRLLDGRKLSWSEIAAGALDPLIDARARAVKAFGYPVLIAFQHEPEALTGTTAGKEGTPADYRAAWRHVVSRFRLDGVRNVSWVWVLTARSFRTPAVANSYYPGDTYVNWVAADGYNFFGCKAKVSQRWQLPAAIFGAFYAWTAQHPKPAMLAEWGSVEDPQVPGRKGEWFAAAEATFQQWPRIKAYVYFNASPGCRNQVTSSVSALTAFSALAHSAYFRSDVSQP